MPRIYACNILRLATPAMQTSPMPRSKNADGSGVTTARETNSPDVMYRIGLSASPVHPESAQRPSLALANKLNIPSEFGNPGIGSSRSKTIEFVRSPEALGTNTKSNGTRGLKGGLKPGDTAVYFV